MSERLHALFARWVEARIEHEAGAGSAAGAEPTPEDLCRECPELLGDLRERIRIYEGLEATLAAPSPALVGTTLGHYRIERKIGEGGMGQVYAALDETLHRRVALKVLPPWMAGSEERRRRFAREARAVAALSHPHIVTLYSMEESDGVHFLTMELVEGETLTEILSRGALSLERFCALAVPLAEALSAAHERGITHRDLKPGNVMVAAGDDVKLLDFGLAKDLATTLEASGARAAELGEPPSVPGAVLGTAGYMSPEQARGEAVGPQTDVWAFGCVAYEMLTGRPAFRGETMAEGLTAVLTSDPDWTRLPATVPAPLRRLLRRCLEKDRERRPRDAADVRLELEQLGLTEADDQRKAEEALADVAGPTMRRPVRRRAVLAVAAVFIAVLVGLWLRPAEEAAGPPLTAIAVAPFDDLSPGGDQRWLANGMTESVVIYLSRVERLRVQQLPPAMDTQAPAELRERLDVGALAVGSIQRVDDRLAVTARLVATNDGTELWSARYESILDDVFDVQRRIARSIVEAIEAELGLTLHEVYDRARYEANDVRAYELWRKALEIKQRLPYGPNSDEAALRQALAYNLEAVAIDPDYSMGWLGVGASYQQLFGVTWDLRNRAAGLEAFERAVELDPSNLFAHTNLVILYAGDRRWEDSVAAARRVEPWTRIAESLGAVNSYIWSLINLGRWEEADRAVDDLVRVARSSDDGYPNRTLARDIGLALIYARGDFDGGLEWIERNSDLPYGYQAIRFAIAQYAAGRNDLAFETLLEALSAPEREAARRAFEDGGWEPMLRTVLAGQEAKGVPACRRWVWVLAALGETERMLDCLEVSQRVMQCAATSPADRVHECMRDGQEPIQIPQWTAPPYEAYLDEPRFRAILEDAGVVGLRTCCPWKASSAASATGPLVPPPRW